MRKTSGTFMTHHTLLDPDAPDKPLCETGHLDKGKQ